MENYYFDKNASHFKSSKKYWQFYKKHVKTKSSSNAYSVNCNQFNYKEKVLNDGKKISNAFNEFFTSFEAPNKYKKSECFVFIFNRFKKFKNKHLSQLKNMKKFQFDQVSSEDVLKLIRDHDNNSSCGITDKSVAVIKHSATTLCKPLIFISKMK